MNRLDGKAIIVTGAASGIGRGVAERLLAEGAQVAALDISSDPLISWADTIDRGARERLSVHNVDISHEDSVKSVIADARERLGRIDGLVNAAGILRSAHTHEMPLDQWNSLIAVNLTGTFLVTRETLPSLIAKPGGVIVNFASTSAFFAHAYMAAYSATKGAIASFTHAIAAEYSKEGLRAVSIVPGGITSGITNTTIQGLPADADQYLLRKLDGALNGGELGSPANIAGVVAMLISDDGAFITGTEIRIDGGAHM
ncbi:SDR family NAD(P)-dependent oxidoreductase [Mycobacterium sp. BMJ-28]